MQVSEQNERMSLDEVVAYNVRRLRLDRRYNSKPHNSWSVWTLANQLDSGGYRATAHLVYDMERPRKGRTQRQFLWTDLVALCGALNTTLWELVLPPEGVEIADLRGLIIPDTESPIGPEGYEQRIIGRDGLSLRLFAYRGDDVTDEVLKKVDRRISREAADRLARLEKAVKALTTSEEE